MTLDQQAREIASSMVSMTCEICGRSYEAPRYRIARGHGRTCSRACGRKKATAAFVSTRETPTEEQIIEYLWSKVDRRGVDECWPWIGRGVMKKDGRATLCFRGFRCLAPRVAWRAANGRWPGPKLFVCHTCDNPSCCNPAHLWEGTAADNNRDALRKGRHGYNPDAPGWQKKLTHCKRGHPFAGDNLVIYKRTGQRVCRICLNMARARYRAKLRGNSQTEVRHG